MKMELINQTSEHLSLANQIAEYLFVNKKSPFGGILVDTSDLKFDS